MQEEKLQEGTTCVPSYVPFKDLDPARGRRGQSRMSSRMPFSRRCVLVVQVCSYRVLASYESPLLEDFSKCILQRHNCLRNSAEIPLKPDPPPLATFRGTPLTHEAAEDIFVGHLADQAATPQPFSWRVAAGKNPGEIPITSLPAYTGACVLARQGLS